ncbi:DUF2514 family protein [Variovorax boronicumulans]|uniref:DUF2514 family protein n=1 Tax=Variovorax boronicumulans TaxID=436515 RepID=UPI001C5A1280
MIAAGRLLLANWKLLLVAVLLAALGAQTVRITGLKQEAAEQRATDAESLRLAMKAQRDEFSRRQSVMDLEASRAQTQLAALAGDLADARRAGGSLHDAAQLAADAARRRSPACPAASAVPGGDPIGVLADVLAGADRLAEVFAATADQRGIRAAGCERAYDSLQPDAQ